MEKLNLKSISGEVESNSKELSAFRERNPPNNKEKFSENLAVARALRKN